MSHILRHPLMLACALLPMGIAAQAQNAFFPTGTTTLNTSNPVAGSAYVGEDSMGHTTNSMGQPYNATVNIITGGSVGNVLYAYNSSTVTVAGGSVGGYLAAINSSKITISGGMFTQFIGVNFVDNTTGSFTLIGNNLMATVKGADSNFNGTDYNLSGTLQDGTNLSGYVLDVAPFSTFTLQNVAAVPEPGSVALLVGVVVTGAGLTRKRRIR